MQLYTNDNVRVVDGVVDEDTGKDLSGMEGNIREIKEREQDYPFVVTFYVENTGFYEEFNFKFEELELIDDCDEEEGYDFCIRV